MKRLSQIKDGDWQGFRMVSRRYERELRRIRDATAVDAPRLRKFAADALAGRSQTRIAKGRRKEGLKEMLRNSGLSQLDTLQDRRLNQ